MHSWDVQLSGLEQRKPRALQVQISKWPQLVEDIAHIIAYFSN